VAALPEHLVVGEGLAHDRVELALGLGAKVNVSGGRTLT
jgi:hypothetical protein